MARWGDENVDWEGINNAAQFIHDFCVRWGRLGGDYKEKYGTVRFYAKFGCYSLFSITHPGYVSYYSTWPWFAKFDLRYGNKFVYYTGIQLFFNTIQPLVYRQAYKRAVKKWPHLRTEILCAADYSELLKGI